MDISRTRFGDEDGPETERVVATVERRYFVIHRGGADLFATELEACRAFQYLLSQGDRPIGPLAVEVWIHYDGAHRFGPYIREDEFLRVLSALRAE